MKHFSLVVFFLVVCALLGSSVPGCALPEKVEMLKITSTHGGWSFEKSECVITRKGDSFYRGEERIDTRLIDDFLKALREPAMKDFDLLNMGITSSWLQENAESALRENNPYSYHYYTEEERRFFGAQFSKIERVHKILDGYYHSGGWTDDYPSIELEIAGYDGRIVHVSSESQKAFMIPWTIQNKSLKSKTYNANLSRAIAALLPSGFVNRKRISGQTLKIELAQYLLDACRDELDKIGSIKKIGNEIRKITDKYQIKTTMIAMISSVDLDFVFGWHAVLTRKDLPENISIGLCIPMEKEKLTSLDPFLKKSDYYINLVLSVPWFSKYLKSHKNTSVEIRFVKDRSLSPKAEESIIENMKKVGKYDLVESLREQISQSAYLEISEPERRDSRWIVLPDHRMLLWCFKGNRVLKWEQSDFNGSDWYGWLSVCSMVSSDGQREK